MTTPQQPGQFHPEPAALGAAGLRAEVTEGAEKSNWVFRQLDLTSGPAQRVTARKRQGNTTPVSIIIRFRDANAERHFQGDDLCHIARVTWPVQACFEMAYGSAFAACSAVSFDRRAQALGWLLAYS